MPERLPLAPREGLAVPRPVRAAPVEHPVGVVLETVIGGRAEEVTRPIEDRGADPRRGCPQRQVVVVDVDLPREWSPAAMVQQPEWIRLAVDRVLVDLDA